MRIGRLRHRITIQQPSTAQNTYGEPGTTWSDLATVWGSIEPLRGREYFAAQEIQAEVTTRIVIRHRADVSPTMRVNYGSDTYLIESVINPDNRDRELQLMCRQVVT
jgi:SPP1 family predicted phage head-tail adaptor